MSLNIKLGKIFIIYSLQSIKLCIRMQAMIWEIADVFS